MLDEYPLGAAKSRNSRREGNPLVPGSLSSARTRTEKRWFCQMAVDGVSVIIPAYNVDGLLQEAYASVSAQTSPVGQIVVVDDGSVDGTGQWLRDIAQKDGRFCVLKTDRLGPSGARNAGLKAASHALIAFLDADDIWPPYKIERQMERLQAVDPDVVSGLIQRFRTPEPEILLRETKRKTLRFMSISVPAFLGVACLMSSAISTKVSVIARMSI